MLHFLNHQALLCPEECCLTSVREIEENMMNTVRLHGRAGIFLAFLFSYHFTFAPADIHDWSPASLWEAYEIDAVRTMVSDEVTQHLDSVLEAQRFNGSVIITHKGSPVYERSSGMADFRQQEILNNHHAFQLASVSKMFTATAVMLLKEEGQIHLDSTIQTYLPEWPYEDQTVQHLMNHRSGLSRYMAVASWYWKDSKKPLKNHDVIKQYAQHSPVTFFTPDHGFNYCNTNYVVLAALVSRVSGLPFDQFMEERVFGPLEMCDAYVYSRGDSTEHSNEVTGYKPGRRRYYKAPQDYIDGVWGDKNIYASISDMQKFEAALWEGTLLKAESIEELWEPGSPRRSYNYGLGWRIRVLDQESIPYHFGWWRGFRSCYIHDRKTGLGMIILSNVDDSGRIPNYWDTFYQLRKEWPTDAPTATTIQGNS